MELVIFVGLQASGKSTFYRVHYAKTHALVSKDLMKSARDKGRRQLVLVEAELSAGRSVVVDNTNATPADRAALVTLGHARGARVIGLHFDATLASCLARNRRRQGKARVPDVAIVATSRRLVPPALEEGFDEVRRVRIVERKREATGASS